MVSREPVELGGYRFPARTQMAAALLLVQVLYKVTTPLTVGTLANPVVVSNLVIAGFHTATLMCLWRSRALGGSTVGMAE